VSNPDKVHPAQQRKADFFQRINAGPASSDWYKRFSPYIQEMCAVLDAVADGRSGREELVRLEQHLQHPDQAPVSRHLDTQNPNPRNCQGDVCRL
jgi:hypothetical protein